ncbi:unnamed protein product [Ixodes pacificus]
MPKEEKKIFHTPLVGEPIHSVIFDCLLLCANRCLAMKDDMFNHWHHVHQTPCPTPPPKGSSLQCR